MSWDISIANTDTGTGCKRVVGQSCRNETSTESSKSIGQCAQGECGAGLLCVDDSTQSLQGNPYKICDHSASGGSKNCVCLPLDKSMKGRPNIMFPNGPPQQQTCDATGSTIPLLYQRCCKDPVGGGTLYDYTKQLCCHGVLNDIKDTNSQCCGTGIIDISSQYCCGEMSGTTLEYKGFPKLELSPPECCFKSEGCPADIAFMCPSNAKPGSCPPGKSCGIRCLECSNNLFWNDTYNSYIHAQFRTPVILPEGEFNSKSGLDPKQRQQCNEST